MIHEILPVGPLQCNCSILGDEHSREAIVVDPGDDIPRILALLAKHNLTVKQIIITHAHIDHIAGAHRLKQVTGAPILVNQNDLSQIKLMDEQAAWLGVPTPTVHNPDDTLDDGKLVTIGAGENALSGSILHTPGHTQGSVCLYLPTQSLLLAGDTLFAGSIGRTDLPGGNTRQLLNSIQNRLMTLPDEVRVIPGHGPTTTIGKERSENQFLQNV
jgi:hydroxyacylglutathione hydrolase